MIGRLILNYKITAVIGEGGMGSVYLAEHTQVDRKVAVKVLLPQYLKNPEIKQRFKNEASLLAKLQHPNIVSLFDFSEEESGLYLIMEYVEGIPLDEYIATVSGAVPSERAIPIMKKILDAFSYAHKMGIVHRDIKPSNIIIGKNDEIKILDFGIARILGKEGHDLTKTGSQMGTVFFMSPEQVQGKELDLRSDIYSLGVTFYQLLTGLNPYQSLTTEYEIYDKIVKEPLPNPQEVYPGVPDFLCTILYRSMEKEPVNRFSNCSDFQTAIEKELILPSPPENKPKKPKLTGEKRPFFKNKIFIGFISLLIVILLFKLILFSSDTKNTLMINFISDHSLVENGGLLPTEIALFENSYSSDDESSYYLPIISFKRLDIQCFTDTVLYSKSISSILDRKEADDMFLKETSLLDATSNMIKSREFNENNSFRIDTTGIRYFFLDLSASGKYDGKTYFNNASVLHDYISKQLIENTLFSKSQKLNTLSIIMLSGNDSLEVVVKESETEVKKTEDVSSVDPHSEPVSVTVEPVVVAKTTYDAALKTNGNTITWNPELKSCDRLVIRFTCTEDNVKLVEETVTDLNRYDFSFDNSKYTLAHIKIELIGTWSNGSKMKNSTKTVTNLNCH